MNGSPIPAERSLGMIDRIVAVLTTLAVIDQIPDFRRLSSVLMQRTGWQMVRTQPAVGNFQETG